MGRQAVGKKLQIVSAHRQAAKESRQEKKKLQIVSTNPPERRLDYYGWHARLLVNNPWRQSLEDHRRLSGANPVVVIITGTGSHSGATGGPVLRSAVENLLQRRQMHFVRNRNENLLIKKRPNFI
jgi:DNA-nicking Smr family endonuclease